MFQYVPIFHIFRTDVEKKEMKKLEMTLWFLKQFLVNCDEEVEEKNDKREEDVEVKEEEEEVKEVKEELEEEEKSEEESREIN